MASIGLHHVVKRWRDGPPVVDDLSLEIADGELVVLVGPSGCGKSTVLRMIAGLDEPTSGEIRIGGERANGRPPRERDLSMVFQSYALYPHLTVFENIAFPLRLAGRIAGEELRRRVRDVAALLQLEELLDRRPAQLSGGQRQRVAMGRAMVRAPRAFLFDEPLSNLDARLRGQMRAEVARLQRRLGVTTVYVTHDQVEAMTVGDRVALLRRGVLQQLAPPRELYERPANVFVAGFVGSPPMNLVPAALEDGALRLPFCRLELPAGAMPPGPARRAWIAGLRPEDFEDATLVPAEARARGATFRASVDVTEWIGAAQYAYVPYDVPADAAATLRALASELDGEVLRTQLVVSLDPASRIRAGEPVELWLDPRRVKLFDLDGTAAGR